MADRRAVCMSKKMAAAIFVLAWITPLHPPFFFLLLFFLQNGTRGRMHRQTFHRPAEEDEKSLRDKLPTASEIFMMCEIGRLFELMLLCAAPSV